MFRMSDSIQVDTAATSSCDNDFKRMKLSTSTASLANYDTSPCIVLSNDLVTHILGFLQLRVNWFMREDDIRSSRKKIVRVLYGYRLDDLHRQIFLVFPSVLIVLNSLLQKVMPTTVYHFHSYELEAGNTSRNTEDCSARITWKGHPNVHNLSYKRIQHTFGTSNHQWPNLTYFSFRVGTIVDSENLCRMLQRTKQLKRLYLHRNINMNANEVVLAISTLSQLTHLVISSYSQEPPISLDALFQCSTLKHIELQNLTIGTFIGDANQLQRSQCKKFIFSGNAQDSSCFSHLRKVTSLQHLSLLKENIPTVVHCQLLAELPQLQSYGTLIGEGADRIKLFELLAAKPQIHTLSMERTRIGGTWAPYLSKIRTLFIDEQFTDDDLRILLEHNKILQKLHMKVPKYVSSSKLSVKALHFIGLLNNSLEYVKLENLSSCENMDSCLTFFARHPSLRIVKLKGVPLKSHHAIKLLQMEALNYLYLDCPLEFNDEMERALDANPGVNIFRVPNLSFVHPAFMEKLLSKKHLKIVQISKITKENIAHMPINETLEELFDENGQLDGELLYQLKEKCTALNMAPWFTFK